MTKRPKQPVTTSFGQLAIWFLVTLDEMKRANFHNEWDIENNRNECPLTWLTYVQSKREKAFHYNVAWAST